MRFQTNSSAWWRGCRRAGLVAGALGAALSAPLACASNPTQRNDPLQNYDPARSDVPGTVDLRNTYARMGVATSGPPIGFAASVGYFASPTPDTTIAMVGLSIPNRGLTFGRAGANYAASYVVTLNVARQTRGSGADSNAVSDTPVVQVRDSESVAVPTFHETTRTDESVIFSRPLRLTPGTYAIDFAVHDVVGNRDAAQRGVINIRRMHPGSLSTPVVVYEAQPRARLQTPPAYLPAPRATLTIGVDDSVSVYLESYGSATTLPMELVSSSGVPVWRGTATLARHDGLASAVVRVPLTSGDVGVMGIVAGAGTPDSVHSALLYSFSPDLPLVSYDAMVSYLRFFARPERIDALRKAPPNERAARWAAFVRETDPNPTTPNNEALDDYFSRVHDANIRFRTDGPQGWLTDRGSVFVGLGDPSSVYESYGYVYGPTGELIGRQAGDRVKIQIWEYSDLGARIAFYDENGTNQWRMSPQQAGIFRSLLARRLAR